MEVTERSDNQNCGWFVLCCSFVATLLSKAHVNFRFSLTFSINLIVFKKNLVGNISTSQCWRSNFLSAQFWDGFWLCSDSGSAVSDVILLQAVRVPYLMWLLWMCSKLCVLENKTFMSGMAHSRWARSIRLPLLRVSSQLPFAYVLFPFLTVDCAFAGIAWKHKDIRRLLGSKTADVLAEISDPRSSGGAVGCFSR